MIAYKGVSPDMTARLGNLDGERFKVGHTYKVKKAKTAREGYHCCENPFCCLTYYSLEKDRFFRVEPGGSIDEDEHERIACTQLTIIEELHGKKDMFLAGLDYVLYHPERKWEYTGNGVESAKDIAKAKYIAIARGIDPKANVGTADGWIALLKTDRKGNTKEIRILHVDGETFYPNVYYHINRLGMVEEVDSD